MAKIHLQTLGCRLNQAESERMARGFRLAGHEIVGDAAAADVRVINSCTVTANAADDSRRAARPRREGQRIVVTGCHSEMHPEAFAGADLLVPNNQKEELAALVQERFGLEGLALGMDLHTDAIYPLQLGTTRAFVKIQDGCNMRCSFCLTTLARGLSRSRDVEAILDEIRELGDAGCQEAVLTGVHAGSYGLDRGQDLGWLLQRILEETSIPRLRLSSLEPWNFNPDWLPLWSRFGGRLCRHLHMSLQSGSDSVLARMCRHYDGATFAEKIATARAGIPDLALTTDIIVGFPGETEAEHRESLDFVARMNFAGAHLFPYSKRPGTAAARLPGQLPGEVKKIRFRQMQDAVSASADAFRRSAIGTTQTVLWERADATRISGLTDHFLRVVTSPEKARPNTLTHVTITGEADGCLRTD